MLWGTIAVRWNGPEPGDEPPGGQKPQESSEEGRKEGKDYFGCVTASHRAWYHAGLHGLGIRPVGCSEPVRCSVGGTGSFPESALGEVPSVSCAAFPAPSTPTPGVSLLASRLTTQGLTPGPLHCLCLLPTMLFPRHLHGPCHQSLTSFSFPPS